MRYVDKVLDEHYRWKAEKQKYRERMHEYKSLAHKEFYEMHKGWFRILDGLGILILCLNMVAIVLTGLLVVKVHPAANLTETNPTQCQWNGLSCTTNAWAVILPILRQMVVWAILITWYLYTRAHTYTSTGMWILTAIIILYVVVTTTDTLNDVGYYVGKIIYGGAG